MEFKPDNRISIEDVEKADIRIGTIIAAEEHVKAKKPAYRLKIDFGQLGIKNSSAQITALYDPVSLTGKQVVAVVNFPPRQVANFYSECLVLGVYNEEHEVVLLGPSVYAGNGSPVS